MYKLYIDLGKEKLTVRLTNEKENEIKYEEKIIQTENIDGILYQDATDWWVMCAEIIRNIAESGIVNKEEIKEIRLSGNKDGAVMLDEGFLPVCAAAVECPTPVNIIPGCKIILSPLSYLRYMLTGILTAQKDEKIVKEAEDLPGITGGRICDLSFEYFDLSKEAAFLMRLKRPVLVKSLEHNS